MRYKTHGFLQCYLLCSMLLVKQLLASFIRLNFVCSSQKLRERRIAVSVELRKAQRSESILKKRNISCLPDEVEFNTDNQEVTTYFSMHDRSWPFICFCLFLASHNCLLCGPSLISQVILATIEDIISNVNGKTKEEQTRGCQAARYTNRQLCSCS